MKENKTDGRTAMERLARELMDAVVRCVPMAWCEDHGLGIHGTMPEKDRERARADIERRIAEADLADDKARDRALGDWSEKVERLGAVCRALGVESVDEAEGAARALVGEHYEFKDLRKAGRVMPEGVSWPRYEDGEPVRMGDPFVTWDGQASEVSSVTLYTPGPDAAWTINAGSCRNFVGGSDEAHRMHGLRLKRPAPKAVGADGVEVKAGDTVWTDDRREWTVMKVDQGYCRVREASPARGFFIEERYISAGLLTHERPDSWGRLREDATKNFVDYWGCAGKTCDKCPALVDGKKPNAKRQSSSTSLPAPSAWRGWRGEVPEHVLGHRGGHGRVGAARVGAAGVRRGRRLPVGGAGRAVPWGRERRGCYASRLVEVQGGVRPGGGRQPVPVLFGSRQEGGP